MTLPRLMKPGRPPPCASSRTYFCREDCDSLSTTGFWTSSSLRKRSPQAESTSSTRLRRKPTQRNPTQEHPGPGEARRNISCPPDPGRNPVPDSSESAEVGTSHRRGQVSVEAGLFGRRGLHPGDQRRVGLLHHRQVEAVGGGGGVHAVDLNDASLLAAPPGRGELQVQAPPHP